MNSQTYIFAPTPLSKFFFSPNAHNLKEVFSMYSVQDSVKQGGRALIAKNFFGLKIYIERVGVLKITCDFFTFDFFQS